MNVLKLITKKMRTGFLVTLIGALFLLKNSGIITDISWSVLWPILVILVGISMMGRSMRWEGKASSFFKKSCDCDCDACGACESRLEK